MQVIVCGSDELARRIEQRLGIKVESVRKPDNPKEYNNVKE